jgi:hypothetical protein
MGPNRSPADIPRAPGRRLRFLFLEPFFGGSHWDFAEGLAASSRHRIELATLPARFWKWRMRGAALHFYRKIPSPAGYDGLIASDLLALADLKALWGPACPPCLAYFHENQLTYPLAPGESLDVQFGFTNITTALAADRVLFNSRYHHDAFFARLPGFLRLMPEYRPLWAMERIRRKSAVLYPGCRFPAAGPPPTPPAPPDGAPAGGQEVRHGCLPLLPRRLSYPEILPPACHDEFLYRDPPDLVEKLDLLLRSPGRFQPRRAGLAAAMGAYAWETLAGRYDAELETLARDPQSFTRGSRGNGAR